MVARLLEGVSQQKASQEVVVDRVNIESGNLQGQHTDGRVLFVPRSSCSNPNAARLQLQDMIDIREAVVLDR
jgi:hypothetical protein